MEPSPGDAFLDALAARMAPLMAPLLAPLILEGLRHAPGIGTPTYATAKENPLRSSKAFRTAYRSGAFPTFLRNRQRTAMWAVVDAWMRNRTGAGKTPTELTLADELALASAPSKRRSRKTS